MKGQVVKQTRFKGRVLIIGGAGFIGSYTADELYKRGYKVRILDNLSPKVHTNGWPVWVKPEYEKILGDERNKDDLYKSLEGADYVFDFAAEMDLMPEFSFFFENNVTSTALLYELIVKHKFPVKKVVVASTQFVYGEGRWECYRHGVVYPSQRDSEKMAKGKWDPVCPLCKGKIAFLKSLEIHQEPSNQYAISKYAQELVALRIGKLYGIPSAAMRYSIVHGPRQSMRNAYSGVLRVFTQQIMAHKKLSIFEDGKQLRDYVSVYDVARANVVVMENPRANYENFNVGCGRGYTVLEIAKIVRNALGKDNDEDYKKLEANGEFRVGDNRHAVSDITKLKRLGWRIKDSEEKIVKEYVEWAGKQKLERDYAMEAMESLRKSGALRESRSPKRNR